jgi:subtilisin family serine protease
MYRLTVTLLLVSLLCLTTQGAANDQHVIPGQLVIKLAHPLGLGKSSGRLEESLKLYGVVLQEPVWKPAFDSQKNALKRRPNVKTAQADSLADRLRLTYRVSISPGVDPVKAARHLSGIAGIEYAEPVYMHYTQALPNDPYVGETGHRYFQLMGFDAAFDITTGSPNVIIAIVDSGVDYTHPDLDGKLWRNTDEIANNNIDDDNNGFIDDDKGWDFWEAGDLVTSWNQDNDPMGTGSDHGTHVAGTAAAETNNLEGIAGTGYGARYMAVKAGGTMEQPTAVGFGYEGILYAVNNGAHVINNSWSGSTPSYYGRDIIAYAVANDVVVASAASNENSQTRMYPASYSGGLSVAATGTSSNEIAKNKATYSNYNYRIDVAATGTNVLSTIFASYGRKSGTSMATPVVSGLAALVRAKYPEWNAERVVAQIRASATNIDADQTLTQQNNLRNKLGNGLINAGKAVGTPLPGITVHSYAMYSSSGIKPRPGESGVIVATLKNVGIAADITISAQVLQGDLTSQFQSQVQTFTTGESKEVEIPVTIGANAAKSAMLAIKLSFSNAAIGFSDFRVIIVNDFLFDLHNNNNVQTSIAADGTMGFRDTDDSESGIGFQYRRPDGVFTENMLFESGLMLSVGGQIYNKLRGTQSFPDKHFSVQQLFRVYTDGNGNQTGVGSFNLSGKIGAPDVLVTQETFSLVDGALRNALIVRYTLRNNTAATLQNVYAGIFNDWDIGHYTKNASKFMAADTIMYLYEPDNAAMPLVATIPYRQTSSLFAINNGGTGTGALDFGIYYDQNSTTDPNNGFSDLEKNWALTNSLQKTEHAAVDIASVSASGPYTIPAGGSVSIAFIHAVAMTETELAAAVNAARALQLLELSTGTEETGAIPGKFGIVSVFPNPFNPAATVAFSLPEAGAVQGALFNMLGQQVMTLPAARFSAGEHRISINASMLSSGVYMLRLTGPSGVATRKLTLLK